MTRSRLRLLFAALGSTTICAAICIALATNAQAQDLQTPPTDDSSPINLDSNLGNNLGSPDSSPRFEAFASLAYLRPSSNNLEYATLATPLPLASPNWANQAIDPDFAPAFNIGLRYIFAEARNDIEVDWTHLDTSDNASVVANPNQFVGPQYEIGPDASLFQQANGSMQFEYDTVNLDFEHLLNADDPVEVRVFAGLEFARISQNMSATFRGLDDTLSNSNTTYSSFSGVGPRLGFNARGAVGNFDFLGEIAGAALIGTMHSRIVFTAASPELAEFDIASPNVQALTSPDALQVIPCIDCKLGGGYTLPIRNYGLLRIEAGYQVAVYFNAISQYSLSDVVIPPVPQFFGVFLRTADEYQSTVAVHGPYLRASWAF